jgi:3-oxoacyl-[acyl-carrier-protein] synthase-1
MTRTVHIVAAGVRCAVGLTAERAAAAIRAGVSRIAEHPFLSDSADERVFCARDPMIDPTIRGPERLALLAQDALRQVAARLGEHRLPRLEVPALLALPEIRPGFDVDDANSVRRALARSAIENVGDIVVSDVGAGHAGALSALKMAADRVSTGQIDVCIAGGVDSYLHPKTLAWLESDLRLAREGVRSGFPPGEGAALLAVASDGALKRYGLVSQARVRAVSCTHERRRFDSDEGLFGEGLAEAITRVTGDLHPPDDQITDVYGDINGERPRTEDWGFALMRASARFRDGTAYVSPVGQCGDMGAATGALGCILAAQAWRRRYAQGRRALVWAGSWGGLRGAALLEQEAR